MKLSVLFPETRSVDNVVALAQRSEQLGFHGMFLGTAFGIDPIMALAYAGTQTSRISLGVAVVPTWPRHPQVLAQQAATANAMCNGRFRLGVGPSHAPVMARLGIPFDRPISHVREYLTIVRTLLAEHKIDHKGDRFQVQGMLDVEHGGTPPVLLAAMREQMCRLAGSHSDGVLPWLPPADLCRPVAGPLCSPRASVLQSGGSLGGIRRSVRFSSRAPASAFGFAFRPGTWPHLAVRNLQPRLPAAALAQLAGPGAVRPPVLVCLGRLPVVHLLGRAYSNPSARRRLSSCVFAANPRRCAGARGRRQGRRRERPW